MHAVPPPIHRAVCQGQLHAIANICLKPSGADELMFRQCTEMEMRPSDGQATGAVGKLPVMPNAKWAPQHSLSNRRAYEHASSCSITHLSAEEVDPGNGMHACERCMAEICSRGGCTRGIRPCRPEGPAASINASVRRDGRRRLRTRAYRQY